MFRNIRENPFWVMAVKKRPFNWLQAAVFLLGGVLIPARVCFDLAGPLENRGPGLWIAALSLLLLYGAVAAASDSAKSVVAERRKGTLVAIALSRLNSAEYADGAAFVAVVRVLRQLAWTVPALLLLAWCTGANPFAVAFTGTLATLLVTLWAYEGVCISATSEDMAQASKRAVVKPTLTLLGSIFLFFLGGVVVGPLWILHPFFAVGLATGGFPWMEPGRWDTVLCWRGWALVCLPAYLYLIKDCRKRAIHALERVRLF